jgi:hypothetical protein
MAEDDVLVLGGVHVAAELVGGEPELGFEADYSAVILPLEGVVQAI